MTATVSLNITESRSLVRVRVVADSEVSIEDIIAMMRREKFTGKVVVQMSQGGVQRISAEDSAPL